MGLWERDLEIWIGGGGRERGKVLRGLICREWTAVYREGALYFRFVGYAGQGCRPLRRTLFDGTHVLYTWVTPVDNAGAKRQEFEYEL